MEIKKFNEKHKSVFKELGVAAVYLFGSYALGTAHPLSDADFGIVLSDIKKYHSDPMKIYGEIYSILLDVLPKDYLEKRMKMRANEFDIVFLQLASPRMQYLAAEDGVVLYKSSLKAVFDFKEKALSSYFDFKYYERIQNEAFLAAR